jgi:hypothetical protein
MTTSEVAARLGVSRSRVHMFDAELRPVRCACGARHFDPASVEAFAARRAAAAAELSAARRARMLRLREGRP